MDLINPPVAVLVLVPGLSELGSGLFQWVFGIVGVFAAFSLAIYYGMRGSIRRGQHSHLLLDLVESGLRLGRSPERHIASLAKVADPGLDPRFNWLAARLEMGERLWVALAKIPELAPPPLVGLLKIAQETGTYTAVIPACRRSLQDPSSEMRAAVNYYFAFAAMLNGVLFIVPFLLAKVLPVFGEIARGFGVESALYAWVHSYGYWIWLVHSMVLAVFFLGLFGRHSALVLRLWTRVSWFGARLPDRFWWNKPLVLNRFIGALGMLLDAGVAEPRAFALAAEAATSEVLNRRVGRAQAALQAGVRLPDALGDLTDSEELRWRLENAGHSGHRFSVALRGWQELLATQAFRRQQVVSQAVTTGLVVFNGLTVATMAGIPFRLLEIIQRAML